MNHRTKPLVIAVMAGLITLGASRTAVFAGGNFFSANNQSVFAATSDDSDVKQQLAQVRRATAKYHDVNVAIEDGFAVATPCVEDANGTDGIAYANRARIQQQGVIAEEPELLFYVPSGDDNLRLVAVGYFNRAFYIDTRGIIPGTFTSRLNPLPPFFQEVSGPFTLFNQLPDGPLQVVPGVTVWFYGLHAWVWSPNPNGMYATRNPRLNCTGNN